MRPGHSPGGHALGVEILKIPRLVTVRTQVDHTERMLAWARKRVVELEQEVLVRLHFQKRLPQQRHGEGKNLLCQGDGGQNRGGDVRPGIYAAFSPVTRGRGRAPA